MNKIWFERGEKDGLDWANTVSNEDLEYANKRKTYEEKEKNGDWTFAFSDPRSDERLGAYFAEIIKKYKELNIDINKMGHNLPTYVSPNEFFISWESGWKKGVKEVYDNKIKNKI